MPEFLAPATDPAQSTCEPDLCAPAAGASSYPAPAATSCDHEFGPFARAEILRLADQGMGLDELGAKYRMPYAGLRRIIAEERQRRGDAWATGGSGLGWAEREDS